MDNSLIYQYMMHQEQRLTNDLIQLENNVTYRKADIMDHLEFIIALVRLETTINIFNDLNVILRIIKNNEKE